MAEDHAADDKNTEFVSSSIVMAQKGSLLVSTTSSAITGNPRIDASILLSLSALTLLAG